MASRTLRIDVGTPYAISPHYAYAGQGTIIPCFLMRSASEPDAWRQTSVRRDTVDYADDQLLRIRYGVDVHATSRRRGSNVM